MEKEAAANETPNPAEVTLHPALILVCTVIVMLPLYIRNVLVRVIVF
jgi:hypothetical protein